MDEDSSNDELLTFLKDFNPDLVDEIGDIEKEMKRINCKTKGS